MVYGYARVSTKGQARDGNSLEAQEIALKEAGCEVIVKDAFTGIQADRPELQKLLKKLKAGDTLKATKLWRLARTPGEGGELIFSLIEKGITVHILNLGVIDNSPTGKLIVNVLLSFGEYERDLIVERTQEGKAIARMKPGFREGRPPKFNRAQMLHAMELLNEYSYAQVASMTGISKSTLIRYRKKFSEGC